MTAIRTGLAGIAALGLLAGCSARQEARVDPAPPEQGTCGAEKVAGFVGKMASEDVLAGIKTASGAQTIRVVGPNGAMTMDYRLDRLTITTGEDGRIKTLRCV